MPTPQGLRQREAHKLSTFSYRAVFLKLFKICGQYSPMSIPKIKDTLVKAHEKKLILKGVSKNDDRQIWTVKKTQAFLPVFLKILLELGFSDKDFCVDYYIGYANEKDPEDESLPKEYFDDPLSQKYLPISHFNQMVLEFTTKKTSIDVSFFTDEIVMIIRSKNSQQKISDIISHYANFENEKE